ncbi:MAG TPA: serine/threonine-protein kinase [Polyangia bacterium]|jgi:tRNA A-37 threonylcarbamoyl transferase component Bud32
MIEPRDASVDSPQLGRYELLARLAVGGMAEIYLARAQGLSGFEKLLVLKRILPQHALDPELLRMFLDEARLSATLDHPHITQVYDIGTQGETPFFTMEYVHGANLREILLAQAARARGSAASGRSDSDGGALPDVHAVAIIAAAAAGLHYAHERRGADGQPLQIVHRDVSPSNVLVTYDGGVKVADFGIAKWSSQRTQTQAGALKGKFAYMSPEQCKSQPVDRRSDVFALGTLLYELTTGAPPFRGDSDYEILTHIVNDPAPPPVRTGTPYAPALARIALRALARAPEDRYPTAQALQLELEAFAREQNLAPSSVALGEYVRGLFADRMAAWESAQRAGQTLGQHLRAASGDPARPSGAALVPTATDLQAPAAEKAARPAAADRSVARATSADGRQRGLRLAMVAGLLVAAALAISVLGLASHDHPTESSADPRPAPAARQPLPTATSAAPPVISTDVRGALTVDGHPSPSVPAQTRPKRVGRPRLAPVSSTNATTTTTNDSNRGLGAWDPDSPVPPP